jgi:hydrogenase maturation protease
VTASGFENDLSAAIDRRRSLVLGYGNPGRQDDGLGPAAAAEIGALRLADVTAYDGYQLNIEDAMDVAAHDVVWFVDAARTGPPIAIRRLEPSATVDFTSHIVRPETILAIAEQCYERRPKAFLLAIRGYEFAFLETLTPAARTNLRLAVAELAGHLRSAPAKDKSGRLAPQSGNVAS